MGTLFTCFTSAKVLALLVQKYLRQGRANRSRHEKGREKDKGKVADDTLVGQLWLKAAYISSFRPHTLVGEGRMR